MSLAIFSPIARSALGQTYCIVITCFTTPYFNTEWSANILSFARNPIASKQTKRPGLLNKHLGDGSPEKMSTLKGTPGNAYRRKGLHNPLASLLLLSITLPLASTSMGPLDITNHILQPMPDLFPRSSYEKRAGPDVPLVVTNNCPETLWPGIGTQAGTGPTSQGFELTPGSSMNQTVSGDWQGRIWGRTNCTFNAAGTGASNLNGNNGGGAACDTGDCGGVLNCVITVSHPIRVNIE